MQIMGRRYDTGQVVRTMVEGDQIQQVEPAEGKDLPWLAPGLVDLQVNGWGGQEFSDPRLSTEKVLEILAVHDHFGVTGLCPTITTNSFEVIEHACRTIAAAANMPEAGRRIVGIHIEGPYFSTEDGPRGAHPLQHCRPPDWDEFRRWQDAADGTVSILTLSPEYDGSPRFIEKVTGSGVLVAIGHTSANSEQIRAAVDAGARMSTHLGNGAHRQLRRHPNYIWDQLAEDRLTASLIVDGHHLPPEVVKCFVRAKQPSRCVLVSDVSGLAGLPPGRHQTELCDLEILPDGRLVIAGQVQLLAGASRPIGVGVAGVMEFAGVPLSEAIEMASRRPASLVGRRAGGLQPGDPADLVLFDLADSSDVAQRFQVRATVHQGNLVHGELP